MSYVDAGGLVFFRPTTERQIKQSLYKRFGIRARTVDAEARAPINLTEINTIIANEGVVDLEIEAISDRIRRHGTPS